MTNKIFTGILTLAVVVTGVAVFFGDPSTNTIERVIEKEYGGFSEIYTTFSALGGFRHTEEVVVKAELSDQFATTTLTYKDSGTTYSFSATGTTYILPAVNIKGTNYRFVVGGALDTANVVIDSAEGDNIEGTLMVAGAVVDCDAEDQINFVVDGENIGDYVEVRSNGTNWLIGDSGVLTSAKLTCTDPS